MAAAKTGKGRGARHVLCGKKCTRNKDRAWPLMPDRISVEAARRWYTQRYSK